MTMIEQKYEVCCFNHKGKRIPIFGSLSPNEKIEFGKPYIISLRQVDYDELRGLVENSGEHGILNSDRRIYSGDSSTLSFRVDGSEYAHLASWGEKSTKTQKQAPSIPIIVEENQRVSLSDAAKRLRGSLGSKVKEHGESIFPQIAEEISSGNCFVRLRSNGSVPYKPAHRLGEITDKIRYHVIEGARKLGKRPGKVKTTKNGLLELDPKSTRQFRTSYLAKLQKRIITES